MNEEFEEWWKHNKFNKEVFVSDVAKAAWNAATAAAKPRWIPISERFPDKEGRYPMKFLGFDSFWIIHYRPGITVFDGEITHWMEIPE